MHSDEGTTFKVYAIRYATNPDRTRNGAFVRDLNPGAALGIDFYFWVAVSKAKTVVIDTGMASAKAARQGHSFLVEPGAALEALGVSAAAVDTVVMTHLHYDHTGNTELFPNATFYLQAEEMAFATGPLMEYGWLRHAYHADEIQNFVGYLYSGRLRLHGRETEITDGITVHWVGGHSSGQEVVRIRTQRGWILLASDALHYAEELTRGVPYALSASNIEMLQAHRRIDELVPDRCCVIAGHDPSLMGIYPAANDELVNLAIRVDVRPNAQP